MEFWQVLALSVILPVYVIILSACSYIGKVLAIRIMFERKVEEPDGKSR